MKLGEKQRLFARLVPRLIDRAHELGFEVKIAFVKRCDACPVGHKMSLHRLKLAIDLDLFLAGVYVTDSEVHKPLGAYWESLHDDCVWGGRFTRPDGNHYSMQHMGMK